MREGFQNENKMFHFLCSLSDWSCIIRQFTLGSKANISESDKKDPIWRTEIRETTETKIRDQEQEEQVHLEERSSWHNGTDNSCFNSCHHHHIDQDQPPIIIIIIKVMQEVVSIYVTASSSSRILHDHQNQWLKFLWHVYTTTELAQQCCCIQSHYFKY